MYAVQRFWFLRAWAWIGSFSNANWRFGLHAGLIALAAALLATLLDPLLGHGVSRLIQLGQFQPRQSVHDVCPPVAGRFVLWIPGGRIGGSDRVGHEHRGRGFCVILERLRVGQFLAPHIFSICGRSCWRLSLSCRYLWICRRTLALYDRARRCAGRESSSGTGRAAHRSA
jgi:hypothetical protein